MKATAVVKESESEKLEIEKEKKKLKVLVAGGGIGGLVFALAAKRKGFEVLVFEKDLSAIRGEGQYRGPIQIQSNALAALEAIDLDVAEEVLKAGCITGDRINGLVDGISGSWYVFKQFQVFFACFYFNLVLGLLHAILKLEFPNFYSLFSLMRVIVYQVHQV